MMLNGKGFDRKRSWPNLRYYAGIRLDRLTQCYITVSTQHRIRTLICTNKCSYSVLGGDGDITLCF
jgi:hypothetical protein